MHSTYLVAKYIRDRVRREPVNVGVMLYEGGQWTSRFIGEDHSGELAGQRIRQFGSPDAYREWHAFWVNALSKGVRDRDSGIVVAPDDRAFIAALCSHGRENFLVEEGRALVLPETVGDAYGMLSYLFDRIVGETPPDTDTVERRMSRVETKFGLRQREGWSRRYTVRIAEQILSFPYAYLNGQRRYYKVLNVPVRAQREEREDSPEFLAAVHEVNYTMQMIGGADSSARRVVLMLAAAGAYDSPIIQRGIEMVRPVEGIVNLASDQATHDEFAPLAAPELIGQP
jgi:hypothetical protein